MHKEKKIILLTIFFVVILSFEALADTPRIDTTKKNKDTTTGPGVNIQEPVVPDTLNGGPLGRIYEHRGKYYIKGKYLGKFDLTGYCSCTICTKGTGITYSGKLVSPNHTVAADLNVIPLGTFIILEGTEDSSTLDKYNGVYQVEDKGSGVKNKHIDIYQPTHQMAADVTKTGYSYAEVYEAYLLDDQNLGNELHEKIDFLYKYREELNYEQ
ncbi:MAG: 3D domain-containing protein [Lachnospiraceae bacterium]|nr:3D domain-containing protein [Lachnospiraceae bacterium]